MLAPALSDMPLTRFFDAVKVNPYTNPLADTATGHGVYDFRARAMPLPYYFLYLTPTTLQRKSMTHVNALPQRHRGFLRGDVLVANQIHGVLAGQAAKAEKAGFCSYMDLLVLRADASLLSADFLLALFQPALLRPLLEEFLTAHQGRPPAVYAFLQRLLLPLPPPALQQPALLLSRTAYFLSSAKCPSSPHDSK